MVSLGVIGNQPRYDVATCRTIINNNIIIVVNAIKWGRYLCEVDSVILSTSYSHVTPLQSHPQLLHAFLSVHDW